MNVGSRRDAVADLVHWRRPLVKAVTTLRRYPWDCEEELVEVGPSVLRSVLSDFLAEVHLRRRSRRVGECRRGARRHRFRPERSGRCDCRAGRPLLYEELTRETADQLLRDVDALGGLGH